MMPDMSYRPAIHESIVEFADSVGSEGPVTCVGGRTQADVGGTAAPSREVRAPSGIRSILPEEMIVRVGAGTPLVQLSEALRDQGQRVSLPDCANPNATVGGALATGFGGYGQLRLGPPRDSVMEVTYITSSGDVAKSGGPVVKNVSGFDLCRLLVGSLGTLGFIAEVVLRATPCPSSSFWMKGPAILDTSPRGDALALVHAPGSVVATADATYVLLEGHEEDTAVGSAQLTKHGFALTPQVPLLHTHRWSVRRGDEAAAGRRSGQPFCALVGTGVVTSAVPGSKPNVDAGARRMNMNIQAAFDPTGRMNPGRDVLSYPASEPQQ